MTHDQVVQLLKDYRCYKYALVFLRSKLHDVQFNLNNRNTLPLYSERRYNDKNEWDAVRYDRIVKALDGAIQDVLSDDQRTVISRKYLDRNQATINEIADSLHRDRTTVTRWHREAIRRLALSLTPLSTEETEITSFDHMFTA